MSATNRDLGEDVKTGRFREDLFYRLNVFPIVAPPLRDRPEDIPALIEHFIQRYNAEERRDVRGVQHEVLDVLMRQPWPGNVRQLENTIFRAVVLAEGAYLTPGDFPFLAAEFEAAGINVGPPVLDVSPDDASLALQRAALAGAGETPLQIFDREGNLRSLEAIEKDLIELAISTYEGRMSEVARRLGMGRSTLYRKIRDHGLEVKRAS
jgi:DNA-binding NtrC family response regulator